MKPIPTAWMTELTDRGIALRSFRPDHWRASLGPREVDYWPTTERWRDLGTGVQGFGVRAMVRYMLRINRPK